MRTKQSHLYTKLKQGLRPTAEREEKIMANHWQREEQKKKRQEKKEQTNKALEYVLSTFQLPKDIAEALKNAIVGERGMSENSKLYQEYVKLVKQQVYAVMENCPEEGYTISEIVERLPIKASTQMTTKIVSGNVWGWGKQGSWNYRSAIRPYTYTLPDGRTCTKNRKCTVYYKNK